MLNENFARPFAPQQHPPLSAPAEQQTGGTRTPVHRTASFGGAGSPEGARFRNFPTRVYRAENLGWQARV